MSSVRKCVNLGVLICQTRYAKILLLNPGKMGVFLHFALFLGYPTKFDVRTA